MPLHWHYEDRAGRRLRIATAKARVLAKFPNIIVGSAGWHRAYTNALRRTR